MEIGTHLLTHMIKFGGHCQSVVAHATTCGRPITPQDVLPAPRGNGTIAGDHVTATLQFGNEVTGTLLQHRFDKIELDAHVVELYGTQGRLMWHPRGAWWLANPHVLPTNNLDKWQTLTPIYPESFAQAGETIPGNSNLNEGDYWFVDEYVRALDEGREHECSGAEGRHVIEIIMGIFESAAYGTRVDLPQPNREHPLVRWRNEAGLGAPEPMPMADAQWLVEENKRLGG